MKRTFSTSFVLVVVLVLSVAVWTRMNAVGSYRVNTSDFEPQLMAGDFLLVPYWSLLKKLPLELRPIETGDFIVVHEAGKRGLGKVVGTENGKFWVSHQDKERLVSEAEVVGRVWAIWMSVSRPGRVDSKIRWDRVLQSIK